MVDIVQILLYKYTLNITSPYTRKSVNFILGFKKMCNILFFDIYLLLFYCMLLQMSERSVLSSYLYVGYYNFGNLLKKLWGKVLSISVVKSYDTKIHLLYLGQHTPKSVNISLGLCVISEIKFDIYELFDFLVKHTL